MGYEATFGFDLIIPAEFVVQAEEALRAELTGGQIMPDSDRAEAAGFCEMFNDAWGETLAVEQKPQPLMSLATLAARGDITIDGYAYKKWRSWEEGTMDVLAPFITEGGTVDIEGEDGEASKWEFVDGLRHDIELVRVAAPDLQRLEEIEKSHKQAVALLEEIRDSHTCVSAELHDKIEALVGVPASEASV